MHSYVTGYACAGVAVDVIVTRGVMLTGTAAAFINIWRGNMEKIQVVAWYVQSSMLSEYVEININMRKTNNYVF